MSARPAFGLLSLLAACCGSCSRPNQMPPRDASTLSVTTLNLAREGDARRILADLGRAPAAVDSDLLLFQEAANSATSAHGAAGQVAEALHRNLAFAPEAPGVYDRGLAILSRWPIRNPHVTKLPRFNLRFHNRSRFALGAEIETPAGPLHVWNVHLDTRINADQRIEQLRAVLADTSKASGPQLIAGDFNSNGFYWLWNVLPLPAVHSQGAAVERFFAGAGFRAPYQSRLVTFQHLGMHLDWIYEKGLEARGAVVSEMPFSDHRALTLSFSR